MRIACQLVLTGLGLISLTNAQTIDVGSGAPTPGIKTAFINAWQRNGFNTLVADPSAAVTKYGSTGLIQQFPALASGGGTYALLKPDTTDAFNVQQMYPALFSYYGSVGVSTAGYPTNDTTSCPGLLSSANAGNTCQYQNFSSNYVLFVYAKAVSTGGQNFALRDPFFSKWTTYLGNNVLGPANSAETAVTSSFSTKATLQTYDQGAIFNITSGLLSGRILAIKEPVYDFYLSNGGYAGPLGMPVTEELKTSSGLIQQTFEGGAIVYDPATLIPVLRPPISRIQLSPSGAIRMNQGDTLNATATVYDSNNNLLTDRVVSWNTSSGQVVQILASGLTATLKAVGSGTATVTVGAEGKTSPILTITVAGICCQIGEGSPTAQIQQAFRDAVTRNKLAVEIPAATAVQRLGAGYVQTLQSITTPPVTYLIAVPDSSAAGYLVTGPILDAYNLLGGPAGSIGYPQGDATLGGRQTFQNAALAGTPVQIVTGAILAKWAQLGYETGALGQVAGSATAFQTFRGTSGLTQFFRTGLIAATSKAYALTGPILTAYNGAGGPSGDLGAPITDQRIVGALNQQDFEGGVINYAPGSAVANVVKSPRTPVVTANPSALLAGNTVHLVAGGFANGATVQVTQTGQAPFTVTVPTGAYVWDVFVPTTATPGTITVLAKDTGSNATATASYTIRSAASDLLSITAASGDLQNGAPGAMLAKPLVVLVTDSDGNPAPNRPVVFAASPGASVSPTSAVTDSAGHASTTLRLPSAGGIALATAQAGSDIVTFSARAAAFSLTNFPVFTQNIDGVLGNGSDPIRVKGALLTSVASILRYYQQTGAIQQPNGLAAPTALNNFLRTYCAPDGTGGQTCDGFFAIGPDQTVNLWRAGAFAGTSLDVRIDSPNENTVRDLVVAGYPVLVALQLASTGGSHYVVAYGIGADGSIQIADPVATGTQAVLASYTLVQNARIAGVARILPTAPAPGTVLAAADAAVSISSSAGPCGTTLQVPYTTGAGSFYFVSCDGAHAPYEIDTNGQGSVIGVAAIPGRADFSAAASLLLAQSGAAYTIGPVSTSILTGGIVNAASFTPGIAPGGYISIFGTGLNNPSTVVQINGQNVSFVIASAFQLNVALPLTLAPGPATLSINTPQGSVEQPLTLNTVAPAIFTISPALAAITNQDNSINAPTNPAVRGTTIVIYSTGLGAVTASGGLNWATTPATAVLGGKELQPSYAGLTPGFVGLYQVNVALPTSLPPGLTLPLFLKQSGTVSNPVAVAVQ